MKHVIFCIPFLSLSAFANEPSMAECKIHYEESPHFFNNQYQIIVTSNGLQPPKIRRSPVRIIARDLIIKESDILPSSLSPNYTDMQKIGDNSYQITWTLGLKLDTNYTFTKSNEPIDFKVFVTCDHNIQ